MTTTDAPRCGPVAPGACSQMRKLPLKETDPAGPATVPMAWLRRPAVFSSCQSWRVWVQRAPQPQGRLYLAGEVWALRMREQLVGGPLCSVGPCQEGPSPAWAIPG